MQPEKSLPGSNIKTGAGPDDELHRVHGQWRSRVGKGASWDPGRSKET